MNFNSKQYNSYSQRVNNLKCILCVKNVIDLEILFVFFSRHDACLLPWATSISAIPVIWARGHYEELYAFVKTGMALPVHEAGFLQSFIENLNLKYFLYAVENNYVAPAQKLMHEKMPQVDTSITNLYATTQLILWGADPILRMNSALLTQLVAEV
jgi:hypothetical protein